MRRPPTDPETAAYAWLAARGYNTESVIGPGARCRAYKLGYDSGWHRDAVAVVAHMRIADRPIADSRTLTRNP